MKPKRDDPQQSQRFLETARQIGADTDDSAADQLMRKLAKQAPEPRKLAKQAPEPRKPQK